MNKPLVSVIIPCYNYAKYVEEAITSVQKQTYKNVELIVINDGSTDKSDETIRKLQDKYRFKYYTQANQGIVATRNKGIELAEGDYLIQLDADDWLESTYVEDTLLYAQKNRKSIVYTQADIFGRTEFITNVPEFNIEYLKHEGYIHASSLVSKDVLKNRRYDNYLTDKGNEDWDLFLDACLDGVKAGLVNKPLLHYRKHDNMNSRADSFEGTKRELLVRHHILSKQNAKHPKDMWYFSPYIRMLENYINDYETVKLAEARTKAAESESRILRSRIEQYNKIPSIRFMRWVKAKFVKK
jgi:glycosyltransferase involved in cell wall biosynthesis